MCTVTFVASNNKFIITHNRDEKTLRPSAIEPQLYNVNNQPILFPKDPQAGGTWFSVSQNGAVLVLLNGAEEKHKALSVYRKSRGLIVLDLISSKSVIKEWETLNLHDIEPFTLVFFDNESLFQLQWNGTEKITIQLDKNKPHIWSSATLYPKEIRQERAAWFKLFLQNKTNITADDLIDFHRNTETSNTENGLIINRNNKLKTLSITQTVIENNKTTTRYFDLISQNEYETILQTI